MGNVAITLGNGTEFFITANQEMGIRKIKRGHVEAEIMIGHASEKNLDNILLHIGSLRVHTERN